MDASISRLSVPQKFSSAGAMLASFIGASCILGWILQIDILLRWNRVLPAMQPNTAIGAFLGGVGLLLAKETSVTEVRRKSIAATSVLLFLIGSFALAEYLTGAELSFNHAVINRLFDPTLELSGGQSKFPSPNTALCFMLYGAALWLLERRFVLSQALLALMAALAMLTLTEHAFRVVSRWQGRGDFDFKQMALPTALSFLSLGLGTMAARPKQGIVRIAISESSSGEVLRRLIVAGLAVPVLLSGFLFFSDRVASFDFVFMESLFALCLIVIVIGAAYSSIRALEKLEEQRRKSQAALVASEARLRAFFDNANDAVVTVTDEPTIEYANERAIKLFGYSREELLGRPLRALIPDRLLREHEDRVRDYFRNPKGRQMGQGRELVGRTKEGSEIPLDISLSAARSGEKTFVTAIIRDVTEARRAMNQQRFLSAVSKQLAESIDLRQITEKAPSIVVPYLADWCIVFLKSDDGNPVIKALHHADPKSEAVLRKTLEKYSYHRFSELGIHAVFRSGKSFVKLEYDDEEIRKLLDDETFATLRTELQLKSWMVVPLKSASQVFGAMLLATGISGRTFAIQEQVLAEDLAQRIGTALQNAHLYDEACEAVRAREDVISIVSHDLKNPLGAIKVFADMQMELSKEGEMGQRAARLSEKISSATDTILTLVNSVLDMGKIQAGSFAVEKRPTYFAGVVRRINEIFSPLARERGVTLKMGEAPSSIVMECDEPRVFQAIANLLGNAIKFTPRGGEVAVEYNVVPKRLVVSVRDTGPGISPSHLSRLFDRHWQAKDTASMGSGLGLYITKGIVRAHGGSIWVESRLGQGTKISFSLPYEPPDPKFRLEVPVEPATSHA